MPRQVIHVMRGDAALGQFAFGQAQELLATGFLKPADEAWRAGMSEWKPLSEVLAHLPPSVPERDWRDLMIIGSTAMARVLGRRAGTFAANVKARAVEHQGHLSRSRDVLKEHFPQIQKHLVSYLRDKPAHVLQSAAQNEVLMRKLFGALYDCLPKPLTRFVTEADFISFCMEHREGLLAGVEKQNP